MHKVYTKNHVGYHLTRFFVTEFKNKVHFYAKCIFGKKRKTRHSASGTRQSASKKAIFEFSGKNCIELIQKKRHFLCTLSVFLRTLSIFTPFLLHICLFLSSQCTLPKSETGIGSSDKKPCELIPHMMG